MLRAESVFSLIREQGVGLFTGVPDSLLKDFCAYVSDHAAAEDHVITANEGNAIALASGHFLATGRPALVYMQNSGLGNAVNPLLSLADREVYSLPMLLMIGWRGEPGGKDEPQHVKQGRVMVGMLDAMEIPWFVLDAESDARAVVAEAAATMRKSMAPVALLVRKGTFEKYSLRQTVVTDLELTREDAIKCVVEMLSTDDLIVSTTGMASRELYEYRAARGEHHGKDFLTVGAMGHTGSIALGIARSRPDRRVICLDGDGSLLMHLGALAVIGQANLPNLFHVVLNNGAHDSVGGQPSAGLAVDLVTVAKACGYRRAVSVASVARAQTAFEQLPSDDGPVFLEIRVRTGARADLGRPRTTPLENRDALMRELGVLVS